MSILSVEFRYWYRMPGLFGPASLAMWEKYSYASVLNPSRLMALGGRDYGWTFGDHPPRAYDALLLRLLELLVYGLGHHIVGYIRGAERMQALPSET